MPQEAKVKTLVLRVRDGEALRFDTPREFFTVRFVAPPGWTGKLEVVIDAPDSIRVNRKKDLHEFHARRMMRLEREQTG